MDTKTVRCMCCEEGMLEIQKTNEDKWKVTKIVTFHGNHLGHTTAFDHPELNDYVLFGNVYDHSGVYKDS